MQIGLEVSPATVTLLNATASMRGHLRFGLRFASASAACATGGVGRNGPGGGLGGAGGQFVDRQVADQRVHQRRRAQRHRIVAYCETAICMVSREPRMRSAHLSPTRGG